MDSPTIPGSPLYRTSTLMTTKHRPEYSPPNKLAHKRQKVRSYIAFPLDLLERDLLYRKNRIRCALFGP